MIRILNRFIRRGAFVSLGLLIACDVRAQDDRRERSDPQLILETGARSGTCDELMFTPDGKELVAAGDDKVVRIWSYENGRLNESSPRTLRWSIWRQQRGSIYALALSQTDPRMAAFGGWGVRTGSIAIVDYQSGRTLHALTDTQGNDKTIWEIAFAPTGDQLAYGTDDGQVCLWDFDSEKSPATRQLPGYLKQQTNAESRVRLLAYEGTDRLLCVDRAGNVLRWNLDKPAQSPQRLYRLQIPDVFRAAIDRNQKLLAAVPGRDSRDVELRSLDGARATITLPQGCYPHCVAFSADGTQLAVGMRVVAHESGFFKETDGRVGLYDIRKSPPAQVSAFDVGYRPDSVCFHPTDDTLAIAGGNNHEVTVWNIRGHKKTSVVVGVGRCIWGVALSSDGNYVSYQDERATNPTHPNKWGQDPWKSFDLSSRGWAPDSQQVDRVVPLETENGWKVSPDRNDAFKWYVVSPSGKQFLLPLEEQDQLPHCYTFLPAKSDEAARLAVGHYWGASIFRITDAGAERVRLCVGHQAEVMAIGRSADGTKLVTAGRDMIVSLFDLHDWPGQSELGATFIKRHDKIIVDSLEPASPAWEAGLVVGDEIDVVAIDAHLIYSRSQQYGVVGDIDSCLRALSKLVPGKELYVELRRVGQADRTKLLTTVRQRPRWQFFPTVDGEWVLWSCRDHYYDSSPRGDQYIGWQISPDVDAQAVFATAEQFQNVFRRPEKVAELLRADRYQPDRVSFLEIEPPAVEISLLENRREHTDPVVRVAAKALGTRGNQQLERAALYVNDFRQHLWDLREKPSAQFALDVTIQQKDLRSGQNVVTFQCFNRAGVRAETSPLLIDGGKGNLKPNLFGLFVGVGDYSAAKPRAQVQDLKCNEDAVEMCKAWAKNEGKLYDQLQLTQLIDAQVSPDNVLRQIRSLSERVKPDDRFVFFLAGHGFHEPGKGNYQFCCSQFDQQLPRANSINIRDISDALAGLRCYKIVLLDTCHSGEAVENPIREFAHPSAGPIVFAACGAHQEAIEDLLLVDSRVYGLFSRAVISALDDDFATKADLNHNRELDTTELENYVHKKVALLMDQLRQDEAIGQDEKQEPVHFLPDLQRRLAIFSR